MVKSYLKCKKILSIVVSFLIILQCAPMKIFGDEIEALNKKNIDTEQIDVNFKTNDEVDIEGEEAIQNEEIIVNIPDENLKSELNQNLGQNLTDDITDVQLNSLTNSLNLSNKGIKDITGLEYCTSIDTLELNSNQISDISPLLGLVNLRYLSLEANRITDISSISTLVNLDYLNLAVNQISNIDAISRLTNLSALYLEHNEIRDISIMSILTNLSTLYLDVNEISDISSLSKLTNLSNLDLGYNEISDITPLKNLTNLTRLSLKNQYVRRIETETGEVENIIKDENGNFIAPLISEDYEYDSLTNKIKFLNMAPSENRIYRFEYEVNIGSANTHFIGYVNHNIKKSNSISVSVPINAGFQLVNNVIGSNGNIVTEFISPDYKITNNSEQPIKISVDEFIENTGNTLDLVDPDEKNWNELNQNDAIKFIAVGLYNKGGFTNSTATELNPIWLTDDTKSTVLGNIEGNGSYGTFKFISRHSKSQKGSTKSSNGKFSLKLKIELVN